MEVERLSGRTEEPISSSYKMKRQVKLSLKRELVVSFSVEEWRLKMKLIWKEAKFYEGWINLNTYTLCALYKF